MTIMALAIVSVMAQAPEKFSYQAVVRNASNQLMANANVGVRVSILQGSASGSIVYSETQAVASNANGLVTLAIGGGSVQQGSFANIDWANGPYFLKVETDPNGGSNYSVTSTQQLMSVPYALYAKEAGNATLPTNVSAFTNDAGYITSADIPEIPTVPTNVSAFINDAGYVTNIGCEGASLCDMYDTLSALNGTIAALRDTITLLQSVVEVLSNPYVESTPMVTTTVVSYITQTSAYCGGIVTSMSNDPVTARGICWSTNSQPTTADEHTNEGAGVGSFTGLMSGLTPNTTYYARAYATNSFGTAYGQQVTFTTNDVTAMAELPTVITSPVTNIIQNHANCGGMVTADGGAPVTERGVCWNTTGNPSVTGQHSSDGSGLGEFTSNIAGLTVNTTYYVCAYATNSAGTAYGEVISFTPGVSCPGTPTVTDYDGNTYNTVQIGTQCWMKENLKTRHYADGTIIPLGNLSSSTVAYSYYPGGDTANKALYGMLYNWKAAMNNAQQSNAVPSGVQGVCPTGWHLPSEAEFTILTSYLSDNEEYTCNLNPTYIAKALADTVGWNYAYCNYNGCCVSSDLSTNNASGFSAKGAGNYSAYYDNNTIGYSSFKLGAYYWTTRQPYDTSEGTYINSRAYYFNLGSASALAGCYCEINQGYPSWVYQANSVRCLKD
jgi:uncharacterized protein (TIGR02145 family)